MDVQSVREAATKSLADMEKLLTGSDLVIVLTALGGTAGSGAGPVIAAKAAEIAHGAMAVVTVPSRSEAIQSISTNSISISRISNSIRRPRVTSPRPMRILTASATWRLAIKAGVKDGVETAWLASLSVPA